MNMTLNFKFDMFIEHHFANMPYFFLSFENIQTWFPQSFHVTWFPPYTFLVTGAPKGRGGGVAKPEAGDGQNRDRSEMAKNVRETKVKCWCRGVLRRA